MQVYGHRTSLAEFGCLRTRMAAQKIPKGRESPGNGFVGMIELGIFGS